MAEGGGFAFFERPVEGADVGEEAEEADVPGHAGGGGAGVVGGEDHGGAVFLAVDEAGIVAPGGGFAAGLGLARGRGAAGDPLLVGRSVGDGLGDPHGTEAGFHAADVQGFAFEHGVGGRGGEFTGDFEAAGAVGVGDDLYGPPFGQDGVLGAVFAFGVPGQEFDKAVGVDFFEPDVALRALKVSKDDQMDGFEPIKEADLKGSLQNEDEKKNKGKKDADKSADDSAPADAGTDKDKKAKDAQSLAESDYQLYEALNLLKGLVITRGN